MRQHEWASAFYKSRMWRNCRDAYANSKGGMCELCGADGLADAGVSVHHKIVLTPENINDPTVTLNWDNLVLLCDKCHKLQHVQHAKRYKVGMDGRVIIS